MRRRGLAAITLFAIALFVALLCPGRFAYAYEYNATTIFQNEWYEDGDIDPTQGWIVSADNRYDAALHICGNDVSRLTDEQMRYLSDPNYGGAFYELSQMMGNYNQQSWVPDFLWPVLSLTPAGNLYFGTPTTYEIQQARERIDEVLSGDYGEGGSTEPVPEGGIPDHITLTPSDYIQNAYRPNDNLNNLTINVNLTNLPSSVKSYASEYPYLLVYFEASTNYTYVSPSSHSLYVLLSKNPWVLGTNPNNSSLKAFLTDGEYKGAYGYNRNSPVDLNSYSVSNWYNTSGTNWMGLTGNYATYAKYAQAGEFAPPSGDWPEQVPNAPLHPVVPEPEPSTPPTEPEPVIPEPDMPDLPVFTPVVQPEGTDYTDWLRAILEALNAIDSDLVEFASNVGDYFSAQNTFLRQIISDMARHCDHLQIRLNEENEELQDYLHDLFVWLERQLEFNFEGFDDTSIISWLRKIYAKLGGGTYEPNPQADEPSFFEWLKDLWHRFLLDLMAVLPDSLGNLLDLFSQLTHYFPFSIPWDVAALLGLFAHTPITPVFDLPMPFMAGEGGTTMVHIDLSGWDGVASMMRPVFLAIFCLKLALMSRDMLKGLNIDEGGV